MAFNDEENIVTYWDEPTITMDYKSHELHKQIHNNWKENKISKIYISRTRYDDKPNVCRSLHRLCIMDYGVTNKTNTKKLCPHAHAISLASSHAEL